MVITPLKQATESIARIAALQRDLYVLKAELQAKRQARRIAWGVAGVVFLNLTLTLGLYWLTQALRDLGWPAGGIALLSFFILGSFAAVCFMTAASAGREPQPEKEEEAAHEPHRTRA